MLRLETEFYNANDAFEYFYKTISKHGVRFADTRTLFNVGFTIHKPQLNIISDKKRGWNLEYAEAEWEWYMTGDPSINTLGNLYGKVPEIWKRMADEDGNVNSNYGWQWQRNNQLDYVIEKLKKYKHTRHAAISIYDGKKHPKFATDPPLTYAGQFPNVEKRYNMCVTMRSNDLLYGFCNDQYQFSKLLELVCERTGLAMGTYYHFAHNLHIYADKLNK